MQQTGIEVLQDFTRLGGKANPQGIVQEIEFGQYYQMVCAQTRISSKELCRSVKI